VICINSRDCHFHGNFFKFIQNLVKLITYYDIVDGYQIVNIIALSLRGGLVFLHKPKHHIPHLTPNFITLAIYCWGLGTFTHGQTLLKWIPKGLPCTYSKGDYHVVKVAFWNLWGGSFMHHARVFLLHSHRLPIQKEWC
jgi:hypothetical protein